MEKQIKRTTVVCVKHKDKVVIGSDGQVSLENTVLKHSAQRKFDDCIMVKLLPDLPAPLLMHFLYSRDLKAKLEEYNGNLSRAAIELSKEWRTDKILRRLEAMLIVANDREQSLYTIRIR